MQRSQNLTKLIIKQEFLATSLPYKLKMLFEKSGKLILLKELCVFDDQSFLYNNKFDSKVWNFKPIVRPLSDLTKEIEHKGERFVPIERIKELNLGIMPKNNNIGWMYYQQVQKLIEWHFDLADLISKGEAIDVNSLEINPYK